MLKAKHSFEVSIAAMAYPRWICGSMSMGLGPIYIMLLHDI